MRIKQTIFILGILTVCVGLNAIPQQFPPSASLPNIITAGTCGDATHSCALTYDAKGRVTVVTNTAITGGLSGTMVSTRIPIGVSAGVLTTDAGLTYAAGLLYLGGGAASQPNPGFVNLTAGTPYMAYQDTGNANNTWLLQDRGNLGYFSFRDSNDDGSSLTDEFTISHGTGNTVATGTSKSTKVLTATNCAANGTAANPSVVSCSAASAGMFSCATNASTTTCQVNTTAVTANSEILITQTAADGGASQLNVTCNTSLVTPAAKPILLSKSAGASFTINLGTVTTNPGCFEYAIIN